MGNGRMGAKILSEQTLLIGQEMIKVETTTLSQHLEGPFKMSLDPADGRDLQCFREFCIGYVFQVAKVQEIYLSVFLCCISLYVSFVLPEFIFEKS